MIQRAIDELHDYLSRKAREAAAARSAAATLPTNHRQVAIIEGALRDGGLRITAQSHARSHNVTLATARSDLRGLQALGLLNSGRTGRAETWTPVFRFSDSLVELSSSQQLPVH